MSRLHSQPQQLSCPICYQSFQPSTNPSVIVCSNKHSICARCVGNLQSFKCPFCRGTRGTINFVQARQTHQNIVNRQYRQIPAVQQPVRNNRQSYSRCISKLKDVFEDLIFAGATFNGVLLLFNLIFVVRDIDSNCVDKQYNFILTARQYFLIMLIWGLFNAFLLFLELIIREIFSNISSNIPNPVTFYLLSGMVIFWMVMEPILYFMVIRQHCQGKYIQGDINTISLYQVLFIMVVMPLFVLCKLL